ncbi:MAG TPA: CsbD family protein [Pseudonocardia sp.]|jgi:uncharacterized protein YjbJ (UPF0337 family)|uniref:CsbD family protein n=1 Tax=Pseudonocardia sp. TaxID=60912 RepID=UPI002F42E584
MSFADKVGHKVQEWRGRMKRGAGDATDNPRLQVEGRADEMSGDFKQAGEKVKDAFRTKGPRRRRRY